MSSKKRDKRPEARLPKGMRDIEAPEIRAVEWMLGTIRRVYESYGFEPLDTPAFEYTDALGKFLPDQDRPNEGVFSFQDEDEQWLSLCSSSASSPWSVRSPAVTVGDRPAGKFPFHADSLLHSLTIRNNGGSSR
jgi:hypothetical protein